MSKSLKDKIVDQVWREVYHKMVKNWFFKLIRIQVGGRVGNRVGNQVMHQFLSVRGQIWEDHGVWKNHE